MAHQLDLAQLVVVLQHDVVRRGASIRRGPLMLGTLPSACASVVSGRAARRAFRERAARMSRAVASPFFFTLFFFLSTKVVPRALIQTSFFVGARVPRSV